MRVDDESLEMSLEMSQQRELATGARGSARSCLSAHTQRVEDENTQRSSEATARSHAQCIKKKKRSMPSQLSVRHRRNASFP